jgi:hypothetical protein
LNVRKELARELCHSSRTDVGATNISLDKQEMQKRPPKFHRARRHLGAGKRYIIGSGERDICATRGRRKSRRMFF